MKIANILGVIVSLVGGSMALAHEGHNHGPSAVTAPHGGVLQTASPMVKWELVQGADSAGVTVKLYPLTTNLSAIPLSEIPSQATVGGPKKGKSISSKPVVLKLSGDHFEATVDAQGAHRFELVVSYTYQKKKGSVKFQVEP